MLTVYMLTNPFYFNVTTHFVPVCALACHYVPMCATITLKNVLRYKKALQKVLRYNEGTNMYLTTQNITK